MGRAAASLNRNPPSGVEAVLGGRAKAGVVRYLAHHHVIRFADLVAELHMSKSAVANAVDQLVDAGAILRRRDGREIVIEALPAGEQMFQALVSFDADVRGDTAPAIVPENADDDDLDALSAYFAKPADIVVRASTWAPEEDALPLGAHIWEQPVAESELASAS